MFVVCAQYWSSLLRGIGGRLAFVFRYLGFKNFDEWVEGDLASVADLQVAVAVAASWMYRMFILPFF